MVEYVILNESSILFSTKYEAEKSFKYLIDVLNKLKSNNNLKKVKAHRDTLEYTIIYENVCFKKFIHGISDKELKLRLKILLTKDLVDIKLDELDLGLDNIENTTIHYNEIKYNSYSLIYAIFSSGVLISFISDTSTIWNKSILNVNFNDAEEELKNISSIEHIDEHNDYFNKLQIDEINSINKKNFLFKISNYDLIKLGKDIKQEQIDKLPNNVFDKLVKILFNIQFKKTNIKDYEWSDESESVKNNPKRKRYRKFRDHTGATYFFYKHIKNFPNDYRMYFEERNESIIIGYIGPHLPL